MVMTELLAHDADNGKRATEIFDIIGLHVSLGLEVTLSMVLPKHPGKDAGQTDGSDQLGEGKVGERVDLVG